MNNYKKIIFVSNYPLDFQESMFRFSIMLSDGLIQKGINVRIIRPRVFFGTFSKSTVGGLSKWLGYADKWILFPIILLFVRLSNRNSGFHICDHSNAPYINYLPKKRTSITCHDVLAIRGAMGYSDAYCEASSMGKLLQKWILKNLLKADKIACVSQLTLDQLTALNNGVCKTNWVLIHNGFNADFTSIDESECKTLLVELGFQNLVDTPYIIHVGSDLPRKNRKILLLIADRLKDKWNGNICFAGYALDDDLKKLADTLGLTRRVIEIKRPSHKVLEIIINGAQAFIFPSFSEGFGWPLIEAQACGTPVVASNLAPMPEVGGDGAYYANPNMPEDFAEKFLAICKLKTEDKASLVEKGLENIKRFDTNLMTERYYKLITT